MRINFAKSYLDLARELYEDGGVEMDQVIAVGIIGLGEELRATHDRPAGGASPDAPNTVPDQVEPRDTRPGEGSDPGLHPLERCPRCGALVGEPHNMLHVRHGNGGGHNEPCPLAIDDERCDGDCGHGEDPAIGTPCPKCISVDPALPCWDCLNAWQYAGDAGDLT